MRAHEEPCARCGAHTIAADGSCNAILYRDHKRGGIPVYCRSTHRGRVRIVEVIEAPVDVAPGAHWVEMEFAPDDPSVD